MQTEIVKEFLEQGSVTLCITGECMAGTVPRDSRVRVKRKSMYWPGDIVAFQRFEENIVSHRFLGYFPGRRGWLALTRADSASTADAAICSDKVLGYISEIDDRPYRPSMLNRAGAVVRWIEASALKIVNHIRPANAFRLIK